MSLRKRYGLVGAAALLALALLVGCSRTSATLDSQIASTEADGAILAVSLAGELTSSTAMSGGLGQSVVCTAYVDPDSIDSGDGLLLAIPDPTAGQVFFHAVKLSRSALVSKLERSLRRGDRYDDMPLFRCLLRPLGAEWELADFEELHSEYTWIDDRSMPPMLESSLVTIGPAGQQSAVWLTAPSSTLRDSANPTSGTPSYGYIISATGSGEVADATFDLQVAGAINGAPVGHVVRAYAVNGRVAAQAQAAVDGQDGEAEQLRIIRFTYDESRQRLVLASIELAE